MKKLLAALLVASLLCLSGCQLLSDALVFVSILPEERESVPTPDQEGLYVRFLNVGQGDAILLSRNGAHLLIDTGPQDAWNALKADLDAYGVKALSMLVLTHPHSDHIGCAPQIIRTFLPQSVLLPDAQANTRIFEKTLDALLESESKVQKARAGDSFTFEDVDFSILSPPLGVEYESLNNYSVVLRASFGSTSFLFTGDAEREIENGLIADHLYLRSDVLKVGHHGSTTSSTQAFLKEVDPQIAVICVGEDNSYGHPKEQILKRLDALGTSVYRTDQNGTVTVFSDGTALSVQTEK